MKWIFVFFEILISSTIVLGLGISITLKSNVTVSSEYVTLYDLAETFTGISTSTMKNFIVAFAPTAGTYYYLDAQSVKLRAEQTIKWLKVITTSKSIKVSAIDVPVNLSTVMNALTTALGTSNVFIVNFQAVGIQDKSYKVEVGSISQIGKRYFALIKIVDGQSVSYSNVTFNIGSAGTADNVEKIPQIASKYLGSKVTLSPISELKVPKCDVINVGMPFKLSGNVIGIPANFMNGSKVVASEIFKYIPHEFEKVIIASKNIEYGQKITLGMISEKNMDVYATTTAYATDPNKIIGNMTSWSFSKGQIISMQGIQTPPDVMVGQILQAYVSYPSMTITTFVRAMQNGYTGQVIQVRNVENGYLMYGVIESGPKIKIYGGNS